jgi:hypothetical protein
MALHDGKQHNDDAPPAEHEDRGAYQNEPTQRAREAVPPTL